MVGVAATRPVTLVATVCSGIASAMGKGMLASSSVLKTVNRTLLTRVNGPNVDELEEGVDAGQISNTWRREREHGTAA